MSVSCNLPRIYNTFPETFISRFEIKTKENSSASNEIFRGCEIAFLKGEIINRSFYFVFIRFLLQIFPTGRLIPSPIVPF